LSGKKITLFRIVPKLVLEVVSQTYGSEYDKKMTDYANLKVLIYVIYNPGYHKRRKHDSLEIYRLVEGEYVRQLGEPVWIPEIGLGIGHSIGIYQS
jgi:Uma2 family endonuclease